MKSLAPLLDAFDFIQSEIEAAVAASDFAAVNLLTDEAIYLAEAIGEYGVDVWTV